MSDRLRELFDQYAFFPSGRQALTWEMFEAAARALLAEAQPQPVEPTDEEWDLEKQHIWCTHKCITHEGTEVVDEVDFMRALDDARAVLARWGRPAPEPVSVDERLPTAQDCHADGWCWLSSVDTEPGWVTDNPEQCTNWTHWLPWHALPVPQEQADD